MGIKRGHIMAGCNICKVGRAVEKGGVYCITRAYRARDLDDGNV